MIETKTTSDCTIYAFVGTAILAISLVVAMYVGNDFHQSLFVESIIFVGSNILLWAIFISMVNYPYELMTIGSNNNNTRNYFNYSKKKVYRLQAYFKRLCKKCFWYIYRRWLLGTKRKSCRRILCNESCCIENRQQ